MFQELLNITETLSSDSSLALVPQRLSKKQPIQEAELNPGLPDVAAAGYQIIAS